MAQLGIIIPDATFLGAPAPKPASVLPPDGTLGVVALFEPGHPLSDKAGVPATGESFNDIAGEWSRRTLGLTTAPRLGVTNTINNTQTQALIERTPKGGVHAASAHSGATSTPNYQNFLVSMGEERKAYVAARAAAGDEFYVSVYARITRPVKAGVTAGQVTAGLRRSGGALTDNLAVHGWVGNAPWSWPQSGTQFGGSRRVVSGATVFNAVSAKGAGVWTALSVNLLALGAINAGTLNILPGEVSYRVYIENRTASGRTFAQIADVDQLEHNILMLSPGGRYYGDTWIEPTSRLP